MVDYEQRVTLQNAIASTAEDRAFWTSFSQQHGGRIRAPYPGAAPFKTVLPNGDYGNADHRMQWFHHQPDGLYPKVKAWLEANPNGIDLQKLLSGGYGT